MSDSIASDPGPRPELTWLPIDRLEVDAAYQRSIETPSGRRCIRRIAENFRWASFQAILAVPAGAERWRIIDGQHRVAAARQIGLSLVPAVVVHGIDQAGQARAFADANGNRTPVSAQIVFRARLAAGDPAAQELKAMCGRAGIEILAYPLAAKATPAGKTAAVPALIRLRHDYKPPIPETAIAVVGEVWRHQPGALRGELFLAAGRYLSRGHGDAGELRTRLKQVGIRALFDAIDTTGGGINAKVDAVVARLAGRPLLAGRPVSPAPAAAAPAPPAVVAARPEAPPAANGDMARFTDDPRARADHGSRAPLSREPIFGRSATGSSLA